MFMYIVPRIAAQKLPRERKELLAAGDESIAAELIAGLEAGASK